MGAENEGQTQPQPATAANSVPPPQNGQPRQQVELSQQAMIQKLENEVKQNTRMALEWRSKAEKAVEAGDDREAARCLSRADEFKNAAIAGYNQVFSVQKAAGSKQLAESNALALSVIEKQIGQLDMATLVERQYEVMNKQREQDMHIRQLNYGWAMMSAQDDDYLMEQSENLRKLKREMEAKKKAEQSATTTVSSQQVTAYTAESAPTQSKLLVEEYF